jgi:hypothetical protein
MSVNLKGAGRSADSLVPVVQIASPKISFRGEGWGEGQMPYRFQAGGPLT